MSMIYGEKGNFFSRSEGGMTHSVKITITLSVSFSLNVGKAIVNTRIFIDSIQAAVE